MTGPNRSHLAIQVEDLVPDEPRGVRPFGLVVHTSGRSIVQRAQRRGEDVLEHVVAYYRAAEYSCHYVIGWDGTIVQVTADDRRVPHVGVSAEERRLYLSGRWSTDPRLSRTAVQRWARTWADRPPIRLSPQVLFPSRSPNTDYIGVELPPLLEPTAGIWPMPESWYTSSQHRAVAWLAQDLQQRHGWPDWSLCTPLPCARLLGHEDLDAFGRWDRGGGWDPGALRARPRFDWREVERYL